MRRVLSDQFGQRQKPDIGSTQTGGGRSETRHVHDRKTGFFDQSGA
ncbi:hypothetical protein TPY_2002 [Sulfobacillus acidophilus TPY]|nr:hypothetical protein TPY_2002 [Sulfobacillus acidophilus TPY]